MATIWERAGSRESNVTPSGATIELEYLVYGTYDDIEVRTLVEATVPATYAGMTAQGYRIRDIGGGIWEVSARYDRRETREVGTSVFTFDTTGGTQHLSYSHSTAATVSASGAGTPPDYKKAIGVTPDGIDGVDVVAPQFMFNETHYLADTAITGAYKRTLREATGCVNAAPFRGWEAQEVLFLGARGSKRGAEDWEITFGFSVQLNKTDLELNGSLPFAKKGWEYLWIRYEEAVDTTANVLVRRPKHGYVERVYQVYLFELLGLGV